MLNCNRPTDTGIHTVAASIWLLWCAVATFRLVYSKNNGSKSYLINFIVDVSLIVRFYIRPRPILLLLLTCLFSHRRT